MMESFGAIVLFAAVLSTGLLAGLFYGFTVAVMPGLARTSSATLVDTMQSINVAIIRPSFLVTYLGAPGFTVLAIVFHLGSDTRTALPWLIAALLANVATLVITSRVNIPLNNALDAAGPSHQHSDVDGVRRSFEQRWVRWNNLRTATSALGFVLLLLAVYV